VPGDDLPGRLQIAIQRLAQSGRRGTRKGSITPGRLSALAVMSSSGPARLGDLAGRAGVAAATMSRVIDILVASGWAERRTLDADHRVCVISITPAGTALLDAIRHDRTTQLAAGIALLEPAEVAALEAAIPVLERLAGWAASAPGRPAGRRKNPA
jgi:DNA-binding MarR family transcriptional regulator